MDDAVVLWRQPRQGRLQPCTTATGSSLRSAAMRHSSSLARPWHTGTHTHPVVGDRCSLFQPPVTHTTTVSTLLPHRSFTSPFFSGLLGLFAQRLACSVYHIQCNHPRGGRPAGRGVVRRRHANCTIPHSAPNRQTAGWQTAFATHAAYLSFLTSLGGAWWWW